VEGGFEGDLGGAVFLLHFQIGRKEFLRFHLVGNQPNIAALAGKPLKGPHDETKILRGKRVKTLINEEKALWGSSFVLFLGA
jgi:hypothetical protein